MRSRPDVDDRNARVDNTRVILPPIRSLCYECRYEITHRDTALNQ
ncbi:hypothetical protein FTUN_5199 [Frigoriglobus tundricola]|uniref:Uncharacterized protein n=1 Tax=Frigoriglobus tundricola TaxID=2774151 RepID=A0A6M5YVW9_9BACT|nr:hypothetical protein FTUN_5199 [Frigoriglobus tundricola]